MLFESLSAVKLLDHSHYGHVLGFELKISPVVSGANSLNLSGHIR